MTERQHSDTCISTLLRDLQPLAYLVLTATIRIKHSCQPHFADNGNTQSNTLLIIVTSFTQSL